MFSSFTGSFKFGRRKKIIKSVSPNFVSSGLIAYYNPADPLSYAGSGSTLTDLSGNGNNGTLVGPIYTDNTYFTLDGINDYIVTADLSAALTTGGDSHTVEMWVYANASNDCLWSDLGSSNNPATSGYHFAGAQLLQVAGFQQVITGLWNGTTIERDVAGSNTTLTGTWNHVVRSYDGTTLRGYLNGTPGVGVAMTFDSPLDGGFAATNTWHLAFGAQDTTTYSGSTAGWLNGRVGIIRVYNRALNASEVSSNYEDARNIYGL